MKLPSAALPFSFATICRSSLICDYKAQAVIFRTRAVVSSADSSNSWQLMSGSGSSSTAAAKDAKEECAWCKFMKGGPCRAVFEVSFCSWPAGMPCTTARSHTCHASNVAFGARTESRPCSVTCGAPCLQLFCKLLSTRSFHQLVWTFGVACLQTWQSCVDSVADGPEGAADEETRKQAVEKCSAVVSSLKRLLI